MYKLKKLIERGTTLGAAIALSVGAVVPAVVPAIAHADALNPLTDRSLTLSSSSPGWDYTDGSGNATFAPPNSGANGQKTGNYFDFKVSSTATVKTMSFQYCTTSAGECLAPGDNGYTGSAPSATRNGDSTTTTDLNITDSSAAEIGASGTVNGTLDFVTDTQAVEGNSTQFQTDLTVGDVINTPAGHSYHVAAITDDTHLTLAETKVAAEAGVTVTKNGADAIVNSTNGEIKNIPGADIAGANLSLGGTVPNNTITGNYAVFVNNGGTWSQSTGWDLSVHNVETGTVGDEEATGKNNFIVLTQNTGQALTAGQEVKVLFFASDTKFYITNPGSGAFFVKINTYSKEYADPATPPQVDLTGLQPDTDENVIDGGVTVANVMNHSIRIQTKVLETMQFSVGTVDPNTLASDDGAGGPSTLEKGLFADPSGKTGTTKHQVCDKIMGGMTPNDPVNVLSMGNQTGENSLEVEKTYSTHSFWRLSSNSSAGATVYYSGNTLSNTVGDEISEIGATKQSPAVGAEQFGLALTIGNPATDPYLTDYTQDGAYEQGADGTPAGIDDSTDDGANGGDVGGNASWHTPRLAPLVAASNYNSGSGVVNGTPTAQFAFLSSSTLIPVPIASEDSEVVDCVTGRMRYIANIAATTPAGIYTTAINYIAAPQY